MRCIRTRKSGTGARGSWAVRHVGLLKRSMHVKITVGRRRSASPWPPKVEQKKTEIAFSPSLSRFRSRYTNTFVFRITPHRTTSPLGRYTKTGLVYTLICGNIGDVNGAMCRIQIVRLHRWCFALFNTRSNRGRRACLYPHCGVFGDHRSGPSHYHLLPLFVGMKALRPLRSNTGSRIRVSLCVMVVLDVACMVYWAYPTRLVSHGCVHGRVVLDVEDPLGDTAAGSQSVKAPRDERSEMDLHGRKIV